MPLPPDAEHHASVDLISLEQVQLTYNLISLLSTCLGWGCARVARGDALPHQLGVRDLDTSTRVEL